VSDDVVARWRRRAAQGLVAVDFDGTLAPIVADPAAARPLPGAVETLAHLAERVAVVAVVSGRPVDFLAERLGPPAGVVLVGLYGLERLVDGVRQVDPRAARWADTVDAVAADARRSAPAGVGVEHKGLSVGLHYRRAPRERAWVERFAATAGPSSGLVAHSGRMSIELRPPVPADKGTVVRELAAGRPAACYIGDDVADRPAFAALAERRAAGAATLSVLVASDETPADLAEAADLVVGSPDEALDLLRSLPGGSTPSAGDQAGSDIRAS